MWRNLLAIIGLLLFLSGAVLFTVEFTQQQVDPAQGAFLNSGAVIISGLGLLIGPLLALPCYRRRLKKEADWYEKRQTPVKGPPKIS